MPVLSNEALQYFVSLGLDTTLIEASKWTKEGNDE